MAPSGRPNPEEKSSYSGITDAQMQLMLLEQQELKRRRLMAEKRAKENLSANGTPTPSSPAQTLHSNPMASDTRPSTTSPVYTVRMLPPPGPSIAPNGFPTNPRPPNAAQLFLDAMDVRIRVFCNEQNCALEPELDEDDVRSWHWVLYATSPDTPDAKPEPVSVIRIVPPPHGPHPNGFEDPEEAPYCKLGRVATLAEWRGKGLSRRLIEEAFGWLGENGREVGGEGYKGDVLAHAQLEVEKMYNRLGFETDERLGRWDEEGIVHVGMWRRVVLKG